MQKLLHYLRKSSAAIAITARNCILRCQASLLRERQKKKFFFCHWIVLEERWTYVPWSGMANAHFRAWDKRNTWAVNYSAEARQKQLHKYLKLTGFVLQYETSHFNGHMHEVSNTTNRRCQIGVAGSQWMSARHVPRGGQQNGQHARSCVRQAPKDLIVHDGQRTEQDLQSRKT